MNRMDLFRNRPVGILVTFIILNKAV